MRIDEALRVVVALLPVLMFLAVLRLLDSYKLVSRRKVAAGFAAGALAAAICFVLNTVIFRQFPAYQDEFIHFGAPVVEELAKGAFWIFLIATARVAFMVDSAICGFAIRRWIRAGRKHFLPESAQGKRLWHLVTARFRHCRDARRGGGDWSVDFGVSVREPAMARCASVRTGTDGGHDACIPCSIRACSRRLAPLRLR